MANITLLSTLKNWFKTGSIPTQAQFWAMFDSFWHKSEKLPTSSIEKFDSIIDAKADISALNSHTTDTNAHQQLFDTKVDKAKGMGLSSNDFTHEYKAIIDKCCAEVQPVAINLGVGLTGTITIIGDNLKGKVTIHLQSIDDKILGPLSVVELCSIDFDKDEVKLPFALLSPATPISNFYIETDLSGVKALTTDYDKTTQTLLGIKSFPATIAFYYNIIY